MHRSSIENNVTQMHTAKELQITSGERIEFSPGGLHLMLVNRNENYANTQQFSVSLQLDNGQSIDFIMAIQTPRSALNSKPILKGHFMHLHHDQ